MTSILQPWVLELGLRHQGCLISAVRGCDTLPKDDPSKRLVRCLRADILVPFSDQPSSFIENCRLDEVFARINIFVGDFDHYPVHYVLHLMHAAHIVGVYHPSITSGDPWRVFYHKMCHKMHVWPEPEDVQHKRLTADEKTFAKASDLEGDKLRTARPIGKVVDDMPSYKGKSRLVARFPEPPQRTAAEARQAMVDIETGMEFIANSQFKNPTIDVTKNITISDHATIQRDLIREINESNRNPNHADPTRPMSEQLPEAFVKGFFDYKNFHVTLASNHYPGGTEHQLWECGWHCARAAVDNGYPDPRPRQEGFDAYQRGVNHSANPYHSIAKGSQEWHIGWDRSAESVALQGKRAAEEKPTAENPYKHLRPRKQWYDARAKRLVELHEGDADPSYVDQDGGGGSADNRVGPGFDGSGFYNGHKPSTKELDDQAALNYRGVKQTDAQTEVDELRRFLVSANSMLRSCYSVVVRKGNETNWQPLLQRRLSELLEKQRVKINQFTGYTNEEYRSCF